MAGELIGRLVEIGFSEYEAKAYLALLRENPVTGYQLARNSGVPRSMVYEVMDKLIHRGAAMTVRAGESTKYAPIPPTEFLTQLQREHRDLIESVREDLSSFAAAPDLDYVWNIEGRDNILTKAVEMIEQAQERCYLSFLPVTFEGLSGSLARAVGRGVQVVIYSTAALELEGGIVVVVPTPADALGETGALGLVLVVDGQEVLIGEWLSATEARASWTASRLLVFVTEHHLRTDLYLPRVLALLGDRALEVIREEDRELFARALESHIDG